MSLAKCFADMCSIMFHKVFIFKSILVYSLNSYLNIFSYTIPAIPPQEKKNDKTSCTFSHYLPASNY